MPDPVDPYVGKVGKYRDHVFSIPKKPKIVAVLTCPRLGFTSFSLSLMSVMKALNCELVYVGGPFWDAGVTKAIELSLKFKPDYLLMLDYDSVFTVENVNKLIDHMNNRPDLAAIFPTQMSRSYLDAMCPEGLDHSTPLTVKRFGHFGLTLIRAEIFETLIKPWFWSTPGDDNTWDGPNHTDADIALWREMNILGYKVAQANDVCIGHIVEAIMWPHGDKPAFQLARDYFKHGRPKTFWTGPKIGPKDEPKDEPEDDKFVEPKLVGGLEPVGVK